MNAIDQLQLLKLTAEDYKLINDALESLPKAKQSNPMSDIVTMITTNPADINPDTIQRMIASKDNDRKKEREILLENVRILQGKLLTLQRYLQEQNMISQTYEAMKLPNQ